MVQGQEDDFAPWDHKWEYKIHFELYVWVSMIQIPKLLLKVKFAVQGVGLGCIVHNDNNMNSLYHFIWRKSVVLVSVTVTIDNSI